MSFELREDCTFTSGKSIAEAVRKDGPCNHEQDVLVSIRLGASWTAEAHLRMRMRMIRLAEACAAHIAKMRLLRVYRANAVETVGEALEEDGEENVDDCRSSFSFSLFV